MTQPSVRWPALSDATLEQPSLTSPSLTGTTTTENLDVSGDLTHDNGDVGFFGATAVSQQAALTAQHAALTQAGTDSGDTTIQALTSSTPFGFVNAAEGEAVIASLINLMTRVQELEDKLQNYGLLA